MASFHRIVKDGVFDTLKSQTATVEDLKITGMPTMNATMTPDGQSVTLSSTPNPFHGWWAKLDRGLVNGFGSYGGVTHEDIDAYIYIDTTITPITITTMGGVGKHFRAPDPNREVADRPTYIQKGDSLISTLISNPGDPLTALFGNAYCTLRLQQDGTLFVSTDAGTKTAINNPSGNIGPTFSEDSIAFSIYKKVSYDDLPSPYPRYDEMDYAPMDYTLPVNLFRYIADKMLYHGIHKGSQGTADSWNPDFKGVQYAEALFNQYTTTGKTYTSTITKTRTTKNGSGLTNIYTDVFHYCPPGSTVEINGFDVSTMWQNLNGTHINGSSAHAFGGVPNPSDTHLDSGAGGSWAHYFYLNYDSTGYDSFSANSGYPNFADGSASPVIWTSPATVTVTHRVTNDMEYPAFIAAITAYMYDVYQVSQHTGFGFWVDISNPRKLIDSWEDLQLALDVDTAEAKNCRTRTNRFSPSQFYQNVAVKIPYDIDTSPLGAYPWDFNDPYGCLPLPTSIFDYNVDAQNYLVGVRNLYYTLTGTPTKPIQSIAGLFGYKNTQGTSSGGAYFIGTTAPMNFANPSAGNPNPNVWSLMGIDFDGDESIAANSLFFGFVSPSFTSGKKIGYIYLEDMVRCDALGLMFSINFTKESDQNSPRYGLEAGARIWSEMMKYLMNGHPSGPGLDSIIVDDRSNGGGFGSLCCIFASLFGDKRKVGDGTVVSWRDNGRRAPEVCTDLGYEAYNDILATLETQISFAYSDETAARYGADSVFTGGKVIFLHNAQAASAGDEIIPRFFLGENLDKIIGAGTTVKILGSIDGRLKGGSLYGFADGMPLQKFSERLQQNGNPISPVPRMRMDVPFTYMQSYNGLKSSIQTNLTDIDGAPTLTGLAGGNPLPEDYEQTIYIDFGFMTPHPDAPLPGWVVIHGSGQPASNDNTTWRDRWLEQAILEATL